MSETIFDEALVMVSKIERCRGAKSRAPTAQPSRVARMLALAHHIQRAIDCEAITDRAAFAREVGLSRARVTQVMDLLLLAPEIQEAILMSQAINSLQPMRERDLYPICLASTWHEQRRLSRI